MGVHTPDNRSVVLDGLNRWKWWISALLGAVLVIVVGDGGGFLDWVIFGLCAVLLWAPAFVRWSTAIRGVGKSFREGRDEQ